MKIRKARKKDAAACLQIAKADRAKHWKVDDFIYAAAEKHAIYLVAEEEGRVVGYINGFIVPTRGTEALIHETRVIKTRRGEKIGTMLVKAFCQTAFKKQANLVSALIDKKHVKFYCGACKFSRKGRWTEVAKNIQ